MRIGKQMLNRGLLIAAVAVGIVAMGGQAVAAVPVSVTQQGKLLDEDGTPKTGEVELEFALYDAESGGTILWSDHFSTELDDNGVYSVTLGDASQPIDAQLLADGEVYLSLTVDGDEMSPRLEVTSVPFATLASSAIEAQSVVDGAITEDSIAEGAITSEAVDSLAWDKLTGVPDEVTEPSDRLAELDCEADEIVVYDGTEWLCSDLEIPTYSGEDFALASQSCQDEEIVAGINADGELICAPEPEGQTYTGADFALSDQSCGNEEMAVGVDTTGELICAPKPEGQTYTGADFALSDQSCGTGDVAIGIDTSGDLICTSQQATTYDAGTGLDLDNEVFSADTQYFDDNYLRGDGSIDVDGDIRATGNVEADGQIRIDANNTSNLAYLRWHGTSGPRLFHSQSSDRFRLRGTEEFDVDMDLSIGGDVRIPDHRIGVNKNDPQASIHVRTADDDPASTALFLEHDDDGNAWGLGTGISTRDLRFRHTFDIDDGTGTLMGGIDRDTGEYYASSDESLKRDVHTLAGILEDVLALQPMAYRFRHAPKDSDLTVGFMAQEVKDIFPDLVKYDADDDVYALSYANFGVLAIQAIKEQQQIIDTQAQRLDELEQRLDRLESAQ